MNLDLQAHFDEEYHNRTPSYCSTCPSSEEGDVVLKWPWIEHIKDDGNLFFIKSVETFQTPEKSLDTTTSNQNQDEKHQRIPSIIKTAIKKSKSFSKKDKINRELVDGLVIKSSKKNRDSPGNSLMEGRRHVVNGNLTCKNVMISLENYHMEGFIDLENIFGIITGLDLDPVMDDVEENILQRSNNNPSDNIIVVQGLLPNGPAAVAEDILIGDYITAINGVSVNQSNVNEVLKEIKSDNQVFITIERLVTDVNPTYGSSLLCSVISGDESQPEFFEAFRELCAIALLTLNGKEDDPESDILFWYPNTEISKSLRSIRGIFLTLCDVLADVTKSAVKSTELIIAGNLVNVCYQRFNEKLLIMALPESRCSQIKLEESVIDLTSFLKLGYDDIEKAFALENLASTEHLAVLFINTLLKASYNDYQQFGYSQRLQLSPEHTIAISNILNDAEAADYGDCVDDFFPNRRLYGTFGTCLFYKGRLVCNHLPDDYFKEIVIFCKYHWLHLLSQSECLQQLVIWKEVYLAPLSESNAQPDSEFISPSNDRWFLLIVGQGNSLLCVLYEVGGAASVPDNNPGPHPYYVDTAWSILLYLIESFGLESICQAKLDCLAAPATIQPAELLNTKSSRSPRALVLTPRKCVAPVEQDFNDSVVQTLQQSPLLNRRGGSFDSSTSTSSSGHALNRSNISSSSVKSMGSPSEISFTMALSTKLTSGHCNTLFHFLTFQKSRGLFISANCNNEPSDRLTKDILKCFQKSTEAIHKLFNVYECQDMRPLEQGVMFHAEQQKGAEIKKGAANVTYWVVGRLVQYGSTEEEIYVCFQDGAPQDVVEMAFKLRYGCHD